MSEASSRAASSYLLFPRHTQEGEFVPLGGPCPLLTVDWPMVHSMPGGLLPYSHVCAGSSVHPVLTLALSPHSVIPCYVFLPLKFSIMFSILGFFLHNPSMSYPRSLLLSDTHKVISDRPEEKV